MLRCIASFALLFLLCHCTLSPKPIQALMPDGFCYLDELAPSIRVNLLYAGEQNFMGKRFEGYEGKRAILRLDTAQAMARAAAILEKRSMGLLVTDAYRPRRAMEDVTRWSKTDDARMRSQFYPRYTKAEIFEHKYIGSVSEHSWGIAVDVCLVDLKSGRMLDMGGHCDLLDPSSATDYAGITPLQRQHRDMLRSAMEQAGFKNYKLEWWHYWLDKAPHILSYDFVIQDDLVSSSKSSVNESSL